MLRLNPEAGPVAPIGAAATGPVPLVTGLEFGFTEEEIAIRFGIPALPATCLWLPGPV